MSAWFIVAVILKIIATVMLVIGTKALLSFTIVGTLTRAKLTPKDIGADEKKAQRGLDMIHGIETLNWAGAAVIALAIWWQA